MKEVLLQNTQQFLEQLISSAETGEAFVVDENHKPLAKVSVTPVQRTVKVRKDRVPGRLKNGYWMADDFNAPLEDFKEYME